MEVTATIRALKVHLRLFMATKILYDLRSCSVVVKVCSVFGYDDSGDAIEFSSGLADPFSEETGGGGSVDGFSCLG
jgi:hypothetical protein